MERTNVIAKITLWVNRFVMVVMAVLLFALPAILDWYWSIRISLTHTEKMVVCASFYCCAVAVFIALGNMELLIRSVLMNQVFIRKNVSRIRRIQWCCGIVSLICIPASFAYMPLIFLVVIMAFLCLAVSVVSCVMEAAVAIREENDLTI